MLKFRPTINFLKRLYAPFAGISCVLSLIIFANDNNDGDLILADTPQEYYAYLTTLNKETKQSNFAYQSALFALGYEKSLGKCGIDGFVGPASTEAIKQFQQDQGLETSGKINKQTRIAIFKEVKKSDTAKDILDRLILKPFRTESAQDFIDGMNWQLSDLNRYGTAILRPDAMITSAIMTVTNTVTTILQRDEDLDLKELFSGPCSNDSQMDALRHSEAAVKLANYSLVPSFSAHTAANLREYLTSNETPVKLTDLLNHKIAIERFGEVEGYDTEDIIKDINNGVYTLQPLPVIEASFVYE